MALPKAPTTDELIARALHPSAAYAAVSLCLHDTQGAATALKSIAATAMDELDIQVDIHDAEMDVSYDAEITSRSRNRADTAIAGAADGVDASTDRLHQEAITSMLEDMERTLVDIPQAWRRAASEHGALSAWHSIAATLRGLTQAVVWSANQDQDWVEWFTQGIKPDFFFKSRVNQVLQGLDSLPSKGKKAPAAANIAAAWAAALVQSPTASAHLGAIAVHESLKGGSTRQSLAFLERAGWVPDPSIASWSSVLCLQRNVEIADFPLSVALQAFLNEHIDALAQRWPGMVPHPGGEIVPALKLKPGVPISLWNLVASVENEAAREKLSSRLQSHAMNLKTTKPTASSTLPRF